MGVRCYNYLGPYLECYTPKVEVTTSIRACSDEKCEEFNNAIYKTNIKHCPNCGSKIIEHEIKTEENQVQSHQVMEEINEVLRDVPGETFRQLSSKKGVDIWISNSYREYHLDDEGVWDATPEKIEKDLAVFSKKYKKEITHIQKAYGEERVELRWGLIHFCY